MEAIHPNLVLIHAFFDAYANNDMDKLQEILDEKIKWHIPGQHPLSGTKTGINEVITYFRQLGKCSFKAKPVVMGVNDSYVIDCHKNWSNLTDGENLSNMSCLLWKFEKGRIVEVHNFPQDQHAVDFFFMKNFTAI